MSLRTPQSIDTSIEAENAQFEIWQRMTSAEKLHLIGELCDSVRHLAEIGLRERHPHATDHEIRMRLYATWLDRESMSRCYDWDPRER